MRRPRPASRLTRLLAPLLAPFLTACVSAVIPRTADIAPPGHLAGEAILPITYATATARGHHTDEATGAREAITLDGLSPAALHAPLVLSLMPVWFTTTVRLGLFTPCEVGVTLGLFQQGGELRCGILQQPAGHPLSLAASAGALYQPLFDEPTLYRAGLDLSHRFGAIELTAGLHLSHGTTVHHLADIPSRYTTPDDHHAAPVVFARLHGTRLNLPLGLILAADDEIGGLIGLVPYVTLADDIRQLECRQCPAVHLDRFEERWGIVFTAGMRFAGREGIF